MLNKILHKGNNSKRAHPLTRIASQVDDAVISSANKGRLKEDSTVKNLNNLLDKAAEEKLFLLQMLNEEIDYINEIKTERDELLRVAAKPPLMQPYDIRSPSPNPKPIEKKIIVTEAKNQKPIRIKPISRTPITKPPESFVKPNNGKVEGNRQGAALRVDCVAIAPLGLASKTPLSSFLHPKKGQANNSNIP